jgi:Rab3 GTPase-activating protein catalytic subunit
MQLPDNLWIEVWQQARAVPVRRQKRLFDDGKEAEKVRLKKNFIFIYNKLF